MSSVRISLHEIEICNFIFLYYEILRESSRYTSHLYPRFVFVLHRKRVGRRDSMVSLELFCFDWSNGETILQELSKGIGRHFIPNIPVNVKHGWGGRYSRVVPFELGSV